MPLYITDEEVRELVSPDDCAEIVEKLYRDEAEGRAEQHPTIDLHLPTGPFRVKVGGAYGFNAYGLKAYLGNAGYRVFVYDLETGFEGLVEAFALTELRTGAVSAVAAQYLAPPGPATLGVIGTGREARAQLQALRGVCNLTRVKAYSRDPANRRHYAQEMTERLGIPVEPVDSAEACTRDSDIVLTITSANDPVVMGQWLAPGAFVCCVGATGPRRRELDDACVTRAGTVVVESLAIARAECGELISAARNAGFDWDRVMELKDVLGASGPVSVPDEAIRLFTSVGTGAQDVAIASVALKRAQERGLGTSLPIPPPMTRHG